MKLREAYKVCELIIQKHSKSFYMAFKDLPKDKRQGVFAVYGFCREVDDAVDESHDIKHLYDYSKALDHLQLMDESQPILWALSDTINRFNIPLSPFKDMIIGQEMDIHFEGIKNDEMLLKYSYHVASSVGLMLLPILATKHHTLIVDSGIKLGYAMQITNILRDIGEDYHHNNRIYLPQDSLNISIVQAIQSKQVNNEFIACWENYAKKAEYYYEEALKDLKYYDDDSLVAITQAIVYYRGILNAVRLNQYDCLNQRCKVKDLLSLQSEVKSIVKQVRKERAQLL
jgi:15-cis-phytoene synthase